MRLVDMAWKRATFLGSPPAPATVEVGGAETPAACYDLLKSASLLPADPCAALGALPLL